MGPHDILCPSRFRYDAERDEYRCPQDHPLRCIKAEHADAVVVYRAQAATRNGCPVKAACTASDQGRTLQRSFYAEYLERVHAYHATPAYQKAMRKRSVWVEPLFGEAKQWHGLRQFRLRGLGPLGRLLALPALWPALLDAPHS